MSITDYHITHFPVSHQFGMWAWFRYETCTRSKKIKFYF